MMYLSQLEAIHLNSYLGENLECLNDEELMARFQACNSKSDESFTLLMGRYSPRIYAFLYRFILNKEYAEDLTQEVFLRLYQRGSTFRLDAKFSTWLYRIARNLAIDFNKRKRQFPKLLLNQPPDSSTQEGIPLTEYYPSKELTAEQFFLNQELKEHIDSAIIKLPQKYREVFLLCSIEGVSYEEAASILDCPVKTVSSRLCRAKVKFLKFMDKYLNQEGNSKS
jgi:RNA polymerase sigma-70 factor (ECF subfamily)